MASQIPEGPSRSAIGWTFDRPDSRFSNDWKNVPSSVQGWTDEPTDVLEPDTWRSWKKVEFGPDGEPIMHPMRAVGSETPALHLPGGRIAAESAGAPKRALRLLQGNLFRLAHGVAALETRGLEVSVEHRLEVFIATPGEGAISADRGFPDKKLDWKKRGSYKLQVIFAEVNQWPKPMIGKLVLQRKGKSSTCQFGFKPTKPGVFFGRVTVCYRGRVLQTAVLEALVVARGTDWSTVKTDPLRFRVEAIVRQRLERLNERRRFDACLVLNRIPQRKKTATAVIKNRAFIGDLDRIAVPVSQISELLSQVAYKSKAYSKGLLTAENAEFLTRLARKGNLLYRKIVLNYIGRSPAAEALRKGEYLQIVSAEPDALIPLEFVYDYYPPKVNAPVCKNAVRALTEGKCLRECVPKDSPAPHVCPLGFWGLSKVIERHAFNPKFERNEVAADGAEPMRGRRALALQGNSLVAMSNEVSKKSRSDLTKTVQKTWQGAVNLVSTWRKWRRTVQSQKPVLLLALPHADGEDEEISLEISGDVIQGIEITEKYVSQDAKARPIVLLLGCDTKKASSKEAYVSHISIFQQAKAPIVLGTVATVFGADAAAIAREFVTRLAQTASASRERFGEILRQTKRKAVADSLMVAMCLVAFGDADWYLK